MGVSPTTMDTGSSTQCSSIGTCEGCVSSTGGEGCGSKPSPNRRGEDWIVVSRTGGRVYTADWGAVTADTGVETEDSDDVLDVRRKGDAIGAEMYGLPSDEESERLEKRSCKDGLLSLSARGEEGAEFVNPGEESPGKDRLGVDIRAKTLVVGESLPDVVGN
jgi:hypothetical protein